MMDIAHQEGNHGILVLWRTDEARRVEATANLLSMYDKVKHLTTGATTIDLALPDTAPLPALKLSPIELI